MVKTAKERLMIHLQINEDECDAGCFVSLLSAYKDEEIRELREDLENCRKKLQEAREEITRIKEAYEDYDVEWANR